MGVSGGGDSVALLALLARGELGPQAELTAFHVDHGLQAESAQRAGEVASLCDGLGVPLMTRRLSLEAPHHHARLRAARLAAFAEMAADTGAEAVLLAHTSDDQAETLLLRLLRGSGPDGLAGMRPRAQPRPDLVVLRPLLGVPRADLRGYLREAGLRWHEDPANEDPRHARVRVRKTLLPLLREQFNPRVDEALGALAEALAEDRDLLGAQARVLAEAASAAELREAPAALRRRAVVRMLQAAGGSGQSLTRQQWQTLQALLADDSGTRSVDLSDGFALENSYGQLRVVPASRDRELSIPPQSRRLRSESGAEHCLDWGAFGSVHLRCESTAPALPDGASFTVPAGSTLTFGGPAPGLRCPLAGGGHRKLSEILRDLRIPAAQRPRVPVATVDDQSTVWVLGHRVFAPGAPPAAEASVTWTARRRNGDPYLLVPPLA